MTAEPVRLLEDIEQSRRATEAAELRAVAARQHTAILAAEIRAMTTGPP